MSVDFLRDFNTVGFISKATSPVAAALDEYSPEIQAAISSASRSVAETNSLFKQGLIKAQGLMLEGGEAVAGAAQDVGQAVSNVAQDVGQAAQTAGQVIQDTTAQAIDPAGFVMDTVQGMGEQALEFAQDVGGKAVEVGSDLASDAAKGIKRLSKAAYDALPTKEKIIEDLKFTSQAITEGAKNAPADVAAAAVTLSNYAKTFTSPVAQNFINDIIHVSLYKGERFDPYTGEFYTVDLKEVEQEPITEDYFTPTTIDFLKKMARDKGLKGPNQTVSFEKEEVYNYLTKEGSGVKVNQTKGGASKEDIIKSLAERNPADEVKLILGSFSISTDENGEIKITDMFDYNEWYHPVTEKKYTADEFEEAFNAGELGTMDELIYKTIKKHGLGYSSARSIGFLLGSRGYENEDLIKQFSTGRRSNISLGNVSDLYTYAPEKSPRPKVRPEQ